MPGNGIVGEGVDWIKLSDGGLWWEKSRELI